MSHAVEAINPCCLGRLDGGSNKRLGLEFTRASACLEETRLESNFLALRHSCRLLPS
jgi:hypothetical protein